MIGKLDWLVFTSDGRVHVGEKEVVKRSESQHEPGSSVLRLTDQLLYKIY